MDSRCSVQCGQSGTIVTLLDSNIVIYTIAGKIIPLPPADYVISAITVVECLGFTGLSSEEVVAFQQFFSAVRVLHTDDQILAAATQLMKSYGLRVPDAIILGTTQAYGADLLSNDSNLSRIREVDVRKVPWA